MTFFTFDIDPIHLAVLHRIVHVNDRSHVKDHRGSPADFSHKFGVSDVSLEHGQLRLTSAG